MRYQKKNNRATTVLVVWVMFAAAFAGIIAVSDTAEALPVGQEIRLTTNTYTDTSPDIWEDRVIWIGQASGPDEVYLKDLSGGPAMAVTSSTYNTYEAAIYGDMIATEFYQSSPTWYDIGVVDLDTGVRTTVGDTSSYQYDPDVWGDYVVYRDNSRGHNDISMVRISTGAQTNITDSTSSQLVPKISGNYVVYQDTRNGNYDIYMYTISSGVETRITSNTAHEYDPDIFGDYIVWRDSRVASRYEIYSYQISTGIETRLTSTNSYKYEPTIYGDKVVWRDGRNGNYDIYMYDLKTGTETQVTDNSADQVYPEIWGDRIVWRDYRDGNWEIYMFLFDKDQDGVGDSDDLFPVNPNEQYDNDGDGFGDNGDPDDDTNSLILTTRHLQ